MERFLTGAGHFGFGFIVGTIILLLLVLLFRKSLFIQIYAPFLPFLLGVVAAFPYALFYQKTCDLPALANMFFFYSWAHCQSMIINVLGNLHFVVLICACIYGFIIMRYIRMVKRVRRSGWTV